jgi:hypothetical protein
LHTENRPLNTANRGESTAPATLPPLGSHFRFGLVANELAIESKVAFG